MLGVGELPRTLAPEYVLRHSGRIVEGHVHFGPGVNYSQGVKQSVGQALKDGVCGSIGFVPLRFRRLDVRLE